MSKKIGGIDIDDDKSLLQAFDKVAKMGVPVAVHAEDKKILEIKRREMEKAGRKDVEAYLKAHPPEAEAKAIGRVTQLAKKAGVQIHFCHMSSEAGLSVFSAAKKAGLSTTCEVTPHHLFLSSKNLKRDRTFALTDPPLRTREDAAALWSALRQGSIDAIASDHAPHTIEEKEVESVWDTRPGIPGLETTLPLLLTQVNEGNLTLVDLVRLTSEKPAEIFNMKERGSLEKGSWADIVVVDINRKYKIDSSDFHSKAKYSPFDGWKVKGKPTKTFVSGQLVMDEDEVVAKAGTGEIVRWKG